MWVTSVPTYYASIVPVGATGDDLGIFVFSLIDSDRVQGMTWHML